jgi:hypothetical protein
MLIKKDLKVPLALARLRNRSPRSPRQFTSRHKIGADYGRLSATLYDTYLLLPVLDLTNLAINYRFQTLVLFAVVKLTRGQLLGHRVCTGTLLLSLLHNFFRRGPGNVAGLQLVQKLARLFVILQEKRSVIPPRVKFLQNIEPERSRIPPIRHLDCGHVLIASRHGRCRHQEFALGQQEQLGLEQHLWLPAMGLFFHHLDDSAGSYLKMRYYPSPTTSADQSQCPSPTIRADQSHLRSQTGDPYLRLNFPFVVEASFLIDRCPLPAVVGAVTALAEVAVADTCSSSWWFREALAVNSCGAA